MLFGFGANSAADSKETETLPFHDDIKISPQIGETLIESISMSITSLFRRGLDDLKVKRTRHLPITPNGTVYSDQGKAVVFAQSVEGQLTVYRSVSDTVHETVDKYSFLEFFEPYI